jgi:hypothetical protein
VAGGALLLLIQILFPAALGDRYPDTGLHQLKPNIIWFRDILAEELGLKDAGVHHLEYAGSTGLGRWMLTVFVVMAVIGLLVRLVTAWRDDLLLATYLLVASFVIGTLPFHEGRYLFSLTPFLAYFAYQGLLGVVRPVVRAFGDERHVIVPGLMAGGFIALLAVGNMTDLWHRTAYRLDYGNSVIWGPEDPRAHEMFAAVHQYVPDDAIVAFFRARSMNLFGDRQALQITKLDQLLERTDFYAMEKDSDYSQYLLTPEEAATNGIEMVWENDKYILWEMP